MISNKAILGFFVVLVLVVLAIVLVRRNPSFLARFTNRDTELSEEAVPTTTPQVAGDTANGNTIQPGGLTACTAEMKSSCSETDAPVCGHERVASGGTETTRSLTFKSACTYCKLYGTDDILDLGDEKYYPLGYTAGACSATK